MLTLLRSCILLAQVSPKEELEAMRNASRNATPKIFGTDITVILGIMLGLSLILFFWAFFVRKRPKHARGALVAERPSKRSKDVGAPPDKRRRRKRRPEHPDNWGRNPTLGETGGLPPVRPGDQGESSSEPDTPAAR